MCIRKFCLGFGIAAAILMCSGVLHADVAADVRKAIQAQYDRSNVAATQKEIKGLMSIYTLEFVQIDRKGQEHNLQEVRQHALQVFELSTSINGTSAIQTITVTGTTATIRVKEHGTFVRPDDKTKLPATLVIDSVSDDVWVKEKGVWRQKRSKIVSEKYIFNGKPIAG